MPTARNACGSESAGTRYVPATSTRSETPRFPQRRPVSTSPTRAGAQAPARFPTQALPWGNPWFSHEPLLHRSNRVGRSAAPPGKARLRRSALAPHARSRPPLPSPVRTGSGSTGVISASTRHPGARTVEGKRGASRHPVCPPKPRGETPSPQGADNVAGFGRMSRAAEDGSDMPGIAALLTLGASGNLDDKWPIRSSERTSWRS